VSVPALRNEVTIRRLRVRSGAADAPATANRAARLVAAARIKPSSLASGSILLVRTLGDPSPRTLRDDATLPSPAWEEAVRRRLDELARNAARPAHGPVGSEVEAVVFADMAELLGCLARDQLRGVVGEHWWWRLVADPGESCPSAPGEFARSARDAPAALELLSATGEAAELVSSFSPAEAQRILDAVRREHAVRVVEAADPREPDGTPAGPAGAGDEAAAGTWADDVPETATRPLSPVHEELLGTCLLIRRRPARVRTQAFAVTAARRRAASAAAQDPGPVAPVKALRRSAAVDGETEAVPPDPASPGSPSSAASVSQTTEDAGRGQLRVGGEPGSPGAALPPVGPVPEPPVAPEPVSPTTTATSTDAPVETSLGGLFYFLNVALALELYGDFSTPAAPGLELDPWDFVTLLGERLLGDQVPADPVWGVLAALAGRTEGERAGAGFVPPAEWHIPPAWLVPFDDDRPPTRKRARGRRLLLHPVGFPVLDVPRRTLFPRSRGTPLERWLWWIGSYLEARLQTALVLDDPADLPRLLLRHDAAVHVSSTRVEVVYSLDELPIEIRLAGLDRTPGWIPAAGRDVELRFE
jgi:hypothetical protein